MQKYAYFIFIVVLLLGSCDIARNKDVEPTQVFVKIYENNQFDNNFNPLDVKQTSDGGFLILGEYTGSNFSPFPAVYLMKVQADGRFEWEYKATENYVTPISELLPTPEGNYEFFCSAQSDSLRPIRLTAEQAPQEIAKYDLIRGLRANLLPNGNYAFVAYPQNSQNTIVATANPTGGIIHQKEYYNQDNTFIEGQLVRHFQRTRVPFPILVGSRGLGNDLFFTAFRLSTLTLMTDDLASTDPEPKVIVNGSGYDAAISALEPITGNTFAMARYNADGENVFIPKADIPANGTFTNTSFRGNVLPELSKFARVIIRKATIAQKNVIFYLSDTKNGQMVLFVYEQSSGNLIRTRYFGSSNKFQVGNFTLTADGGMAIVGKNFVAGRFARICLFKLSPKEVEDLVK
ncbi:MAG: hypothetical protein OHK0045_15070 [Raineya sp.]